ncbi:unnamed protein product [Amaranthus hypochondriacus]
MGIFGESKACPKREIRSTKQVKKFSKTSLLDVLAQGGNISSYTAEDGTVRIKILVNKQDFKRIINNASSSPSIGSNRDRSINSPSSIASSPSMERRLYDLMRRKKKSMGTKSCSTWLPVLQSIPEEHC